MKNKISFIMPLYKKKLIIDITIIAMCFLCILLLSCSYRNVSYYKNEIKNTKENVIKYKYVNISGDTISINRAF